MSTDPQPAEQGTGTSSGAGGRPDEGSAAADGHRPAAARPVAAAPGSGLVARLLTVVYALVVTPIATGLLAYGGTGWLQYTMTHGYVGGSPRDLLGNPVGVRILLGVVLGLLLLASVVATGIVSSAGLLAVGALSLVSVVLSAVPSLLLEVYLTASQFVPHEALDGLVFGLPLVLHPLMGGFGLALLFARRRPDPHLIASIAGLVVVPLVLLLSVWPLFLGLGKGAAYALRALETSIDPVVVVLVIAGALLAGLGGAASRWSPYALVAPALVVLGASLMTLLPQAVGQFPQLWASPAGQSMMTFLILGGGAAVGVVMLVHTVVLAIVRSRARRRALAPAG